MRIIDTHTHIDFDDFDKDRDTIIKRAQDNHVSDIIISATSADRWQLIKQTREAYSHICHAAYGLHPMFMQEHNLDKDLIELDNWLQSNRAVAIGEIGLDYFIKEADDAHRKLQESLFVSQCEIANTHGLPVIIHARKSLDIILKHIRRYSNLKGSIHSFSGSLQQAKQFLDLGFYLSFGGPITYDRAIRLHKVVKEMPLEALLVETDSPDQPDSSHHSQRNEPAFILNVVEKVAELKNVEIEVVANQTTKNAIKLFNLHPS